MVLGFGGAMNLLCLRILSVALDPTSLFKWAET